MTPVDATDELSQIISNNNYEEVNIQLIDLDGWQLEDLQRVLQIVDNEVADRCNNALENMLDESDQAGY